MRISSSQYHETAIRNIQTSSAKYSQLSVQMATNERITKPSDDPLGSVLVLRLDSELTSLEQYGKNMELVTYTLSQQETQLTSINSLLLSVQTLVTAAADASATLKVDAGSLGDTTQSTSGYGGIVLVQNTDTLTVKTGAVFDVVKSQDILNAAPGDVVTYTFTVRNTGSTAGDTTLTDTIGLLVVFGITTQSVLVGIAVFGFQLPALFQSVSIFPVQTLPPLIVTVVSSVNTTVPEHKA